MKSGSRGSDQVFDQLIAHQNVMEESRAMGQFFIEHWRKGKLIEEFKSPNLIVNQGLVYMVGAWLINVAAIAAWRVILVDDTPTIVAGDTYATHAGWTEVTGYDEAVRPVWTGVAGAAGIVTNAASRAEFTITANSTLVGGVALVGGGSDPTVKGNTAGGGTLFSASVFGGGNRTLAAADVLRITWQHTYANV